MPLFNGTNKKDSIYGGVGNDTILGLEDDDNLEGDIGEDSIDGGSGNDYINGEPGADTILGGDGDDSISGGEGNDLIYGGNGNDKINYVDDTGNDTVYGGAGNDLINYYLISGNKTIAGDDGEDTVFGATGNDSISGGNGNDSLNGSSGNDSLDGGSGNDYLAGDDGNDSLVGGDGNDSLNGGAGNDLIQAGSGDDEVNYISDIGNDTVYGADGNDVINYTAINGNKLLFGENGNDAISGGNGNDSIDGGLGNDTIYGGTGNDSILGGSGNDNLWGDEGNDTLDGGDGNDSLRGWTGNDIYLGGEGDDYIYDSEGDNSINVGNGNDTVFGGDGNDLIMGGAGNDNLDGYSGNDTIDGGDGNNYIYSGDGADLITSGSGNDSINGSLKDASNPNGAYTFFSYSGSKTISSGLGNDFIYSGTGADSISAGDGNDVVYGSSGNDSIDGGSGSDNLNGDDGNDSIEGGIGNDFIYGSLGDDTLDGGLGNDELYGGTGNDSLIGGEGNDYLSDSGGNNYFDAGNGNDTVYGDSGNDTVIGGNGNDSVIGWSGNDSLLGGDGDDTLSGGDGNDIIDGGVGNDELYGGAGTDSIVGGFGNDYIQGDIGDDTLIGGDGNDSLSGGSGNDLIQAGAGDDEISYLSDTGNDTIYGGDGNDYINYSSLTGNKLLYGESGNDSLNGGNGNDTLDGGIGNDILCGGEGNDLYYIDSIFDRIYDSGGNDTAYVSENFVKIPSSIEKVIYLNGAQALPYWIDALLPDESAGLFFKSILGNPAVIKYSFPSSIPSYDTNKDDAKGYLSFTQIQITRAKEALAYISGIVNLEFIETTNSAQDNTIAFANNSQTDSSGYARYPDSSYYSASDVFLNKSTDGTFTLRDGEFQTYTLIHEIGHSLGLEHPFNTVGSTGTLADPPFLTGSEDSTTWTVMSYTESSAQYYLQYSPLDIAALQYLYGPSKTSRAGNDTYKISTSTPNFIWDGAGSDVIDAAAATQAATIYLTPGYQGFLGLTKAEKITSAGQITVNFGTVIENLIGSNYDDHLYGNEVGNKIEGGTGSDSIEGWDGDDTLLGGAGNDFLTGGSGNDSIEGGDGNDTLVVNGLATNYLIRYDSTTLNYSIEAKSGTEGKDTFKTIEFLKFSDKTIALQSIDVTPPTIAISSNLTSLGIGKTTTISFIISESVNDFVLADVVVTGGTLSNFTGSGSAYAATFTPSLNFTGTASIKVASGKFTDSAGNTNEDGSDANNNLSITVDTQAPVVTTYSPENSATKVGLASDIVLTFSEKIQKGIGNVVLKTSTGVTVATYDVALSSNLSITDTTLTINPTANLLFDTIYKVEITSGSIKDLFGNDLAAIATYSFTTGSNQLPTGNVTITGTSKQGQTLQATNNLADADGLGAITYQWQSSSDNLNWTTLGVGSTYTLQEAQVGKKIKVNALYTDGHGTNESVSSTPSSAVVNVNDTPTGNVVITGALKQGETLKATNSIQDPDGVGVITYQWQSSFDGVNWTNTLISAGDTFTLTEREVNRQISVIASYTDGHGTAEKLTSSSTDKLSANLILGTSNSEMLQGTPFADNISGYAGNDTITGGLGSDLIDGGTGIDTVKFFGQFGSASLANYSIQKLSDVSWSVSYIGPIAAIFPPPPTDGSDSLTSVERIQFTDKSFALDLDGNAGNTAKIIGAVLGKAALKNPTYVGIGLSYLDKGMSYSDLGALALNAVGATTNDAIVSTLWLNVIGSTATALDKAPFIKMLSDGMKAGDLVALAADTAFNTSNINLVGLAQTGIEYIPV